MSNKTAISIGSITDPENPWPGLAAYTEADARFFHGREAETIGLLNLVLRERLVVLFGRSGLGKTSLLQAGLFPELRQKCLLPVLIRLDFRPEALPPREQIRVSLLSACEEAQVETPEAWQGDSLWELFHRKEFELWSPLNRLIFPALVFDPFEEVLTLDQQSIKRDAFLNELADLAEGRPPADLGTRLAKSPAAARQFSFQRHPYKILLCLREDYLADLERLRSRMPSVMTSRMLLSPMKGDAALLVARAGAHLLDEGVAERIVRFVAGGEFEGQPEPLLEELEVDPALLSVVCRELNDRRRQLGQTRITVDLLQGSRDSILADFYKRSLEGLDPRVQTFVEESLLTPSGLRDSVAEEIALTKAGISHEVLDTLVDRRILRIEDHFRAPRYELAHDLLTRVVRDSRDAHRAIEATSRAIEEERRRVERHELEKRKKLKVLTGVLAALFLVVALLAIQSYTARQTIKQTLNGVYLGKAGEQIDRRAALAYLAAAVRNDNKSVLARGLLVGKLLYESWLLPIAEIQKKPLAISLNGRFLAVEPSRSSIQIWDMRALRPVGPLILLPPDPADDRPDKPLNVQLSEDGQRLLTFRNGTLHIWNTRTGARIGTRTNLDYAGVLLSPRGTGVALISGAGIVLWNPGIRPERVLSHEGFLDRGRFSSDGRFLAGFGWDLEARRSRVDVWEAASGRRIASLSLPILHSLDFSPDGGQFVTVSDGIAQIWAVNSSRLRATLQAPDGSALHEARFLADGLDLITLSSNAAYVWRVEDGSLLTTVALGMGASQAQVSQDRRWLLTLSSSGVAVWDLKTGTQIGERLNGDAGSFIPETPFLMSLSSDRARVWRIKPGAIPHEVIFSRKPLPARLVLGGDLVVVPEASTLRIRDIRTRRITAELSGAQAVIRFGSSPSFQASSDGKYVSTSTRNGIQVWDLVLRRLAGILPECGGCDYSLSPDGRWIATFRGNKLPIHEVATGRINVSLLQKDLVEWFQFGQRGKRVVTASKDTVYVWDIHTGERSRSLRPGPISIVTTAAMSPDEERVAVGSIEGEAYILDAESGRILSGPLLHDKKPVSLLLFCSDGRTLLTAATSTVRIWDADASALLGEPFSTGDWIRLARCNPNGSSILIAAGHRAWLLDPVSGRPIYGPLEMDSFVEDAAFSPDGQSIRIASRTRVKIWDLPLPPSSEAAELARFAEAVSGQALDGEGRLIELADPSEKLESMRQSTPGEDTLDELVRRFFATGGDS